MEISKGSYGMSLNQRKYVQEILSAHGLLCCMPLPHHFPQASLFVKVQKRFIRNQRCIDDQLDNFSILISLNHILLMVIQQLSQFVAKPTTMHQNATIHVLKYRKRCPSFGVFYSTHNTFQLQAYSDAYWGLFVDTRKSLTGFCAFLGSSLISWKCKKQSTMYVSYVEAEYIVMATTTRELLWLQNLISEFHIQSSTPIALYCNNIITIQITKNHVFHERTKHLDIDCHIVREKFLQGFLTPTTVSSADHLADSFTKALYQGR